MALQRYAGVMDVMVQKHFASYWDNQKEIVVYSTVEKYTFELACRLFVSSEYPNEVQKIFLRFREIVSGIISVPFDLPGTTFRKAIRASEFMRKEIGEIIKQTRVDLAGKGLVDCVVFLAGYLWVEAVKLFWG